MSFSFFLSKPIFYVIFLVKSKCNFFSFIKCEKANFQAKSNFTFLKHYFIGNISAKNQYHSTNVNRKVIIKNGIT